jgi:hypothetical protein
LIGDYIESGLNVLTSYRINVRCHGQILPKIENKKTSGASAKEVASKSGRLIDRVSKPHSRKQQKAGIR